jgi:hypothetical protein
VIALAGLAISFAFPAFAEQKDTADPKIEQQIRAFTMKLTRHSTGATLPPSPRSSPRTEFYPDRTEDLTVGLP